MKIVVGVIRSTALERTVKDLAKIDIKNLTITEVKGIGEQIDPFTSIADHKVLLSIVPDEKADGVAQVILNAARTGFAGDGIIVVCPVDYMIKIRTSEREG